MNMLSRSAFLSLLVGVASVFQAAADPILPYQQRIEMRLTNQIALGVGDLTTLNKALDAFHKKSKNLSGDITILQNLNNILDEELGYPPLISDAATDYLTDFSVRRDVLYELLRPAPRSSTKESARKSLGKLDNALSNAVIATNITSELSYLQTAAQKLNTSSNNVQMALKQPIKLSSMGAFVGALKFKSSAGYVTGGTNFATNPGTAVGEFSPQAGTLTLSAIDNGTFTRGISLHVEGIVPFAPVTYPLCVGNNTAFYDVTDTSVAKEYHFLGTASMTNSVVTNAWLTIDYIGTNYILGRFAFRGTNAFPTSASDTNTAVTVSQGDFQLNYFH